MKLPSEMTPAERREAIDAGRLSIHRASRVDITVRRDKCVPHEIIDVQPGCWIEIREYSKYGGATLRRCFVHEKSIGPWEWIEEERG